MLIDAGADVNLKSEWENGPYAVLDNANEDTARFLLAHGAHTDAERGGASRLVRRAADDWWTATPRSCTREEATASSRCTRRRPSRLPTFLLDRGAGIDVRCIDHKSTPAQYALVDRPDVCRRAARARGRRPTSSWPPALATSALATRLLDADPSCVAARINAAGISAGAAVQHLLLDARVRHVSARGRA